MTHEKEKPIDHVIDKEEEKGLPHKKRRSWIDKDEEEPIKQKKKRPEDKLLTLEKKEKTDRSCDRSIKKRKKGVAS